MSLNIAQKWGKYFGLFEREYEKEAGYYTILWHYATLLALVASYNKHRKPDSVQ